ncbi:hypothetical protein [Actinocorallia aurantiaca]|uniref:Lytic transglycosylase domain-containing protein n=1 Tax=Actinocorallia aurantiaca TaxID=46204 RepID=A0ABP6GL91_9ACTN
MIGTCPSWISRLPVAAVAALAATGLWSAPAAAESDAVSRPSGLDAAAGTVPQIHRIHRVHRVGRTAEVHRLARPGKAPEAQVIQKVQKLRTLKKAVKTVESVKAVKAVKSVKLSRQSRKLRSASRVERNKQIGLDLAADFGWDGRRQWRCLERLWSRESGWNHLARNPSSGAHGIPQALPGSKMGGISADWRTNPETQIKWGLRYIKGRYGTPCGAWAHFGASGWY